MGVASRWTFYHFNLRAAGLKLAAQSFTRKERLEHREISTIVLRVLHQLYLFSHCRDFGISEFYFCGA